MSYQSYASLGDVSSLANCGYGNLIVELETSFVGAEYWSGTVFVPGTTIEGNFSPFGMATLTDQAGNQGRYFIYGWQDSAREVQDELCSSSHHNFKSLPDFS